MAGSCSVGSCGHSGHMICVLAYGERDCFFLLGSFQKDVGKEVVFGECKEKGSRKTEAMSAGSEGRGLRDLEKKTSSESEKPSRVGAAGSRLDADAVAEGCRGPSLL